MFLKKFLIIFFVTLVPFEILLLSANIDSSYWLREDIH